jgi:haloacetate dehalogenase
MCEDYRATFGVDLDMDTADFNAGKKVACPSMILWGAKGGVGRNHDAAAVWADYASRIERTATVPSGHYLQEECPDETYTELRNFLTA